MKYSYLILLFISSLMLNSCDSPNRKVVSFPETKEIKAELVSINEIFQPDFLTIKNNYLVVASSKTDYSLYIYSLPSMEFLNAAVRKGRGPHEIPIFPMFCESPSSDMLYVWGYSPTTIEKNRILKDGTLGFEAEFALSKYEAFNNMSIMNDSLFIYFLPDELTIKKYDLTIKKEVGVISFKRDEHKESYFYANRGNVANNEKYIVYPYIFKNRIDIYDLNSLKLSRCITGSKKSPKPVPGDFSSITYHYRYVYAGKDYFYALHGGNENGVLREIRLEVYDYDGNPAKEYLLDIMPDIFVVDEKDSMLYGFNSQYSDHIVKYAL